MLRPNSKTTLYISSKVFRYAITIFVIITLNFLIPHMMPGDPLYSIFSEEKVMLYDEDTIKELRAYYGLDKPLYEQYVNYLTALTRFDLGYSLLKNIAVSRLIWDCMFWSLLLLLPSSLVGSMIALVLGSVVGYRHGSTLDTAITSIMLFIYTLPSFFFAMLTVIIFSFYLDWFPLGSASSGTTTNPVSYILDVCWHLFLPWVVLAISQAVYMYFVIKNSVTQIMGEYFVFIARAKGLSEKVVVLKHVMRNVMPQFISMMALDLGFMVGGALIIETVFSLRGMGTLTYDAVAGRDYPVIQGCFFVMTIFVLIANFIADVLYGIADPRIADAKDGR